MSTSASDRASGRRARAALFLVLAVLASLAACTDGGPGAADPGPTTPPPGSGSPPPAGTGKVTLQWARPTSNEDGSALVDLAGYKVYYGSSAYALDASVDVHGSSVTSAEIDGLAHGTWYFAIASYNANGVESSKSGVVSTTL